MPGPERVVEVIKTVTAESQASPGAQRVGDVIKQQSAQAAVQAARASERHTALQNSIARAEAAEAKVQALQQELASVRSALAESETEQTELAALADQVATLQEEATEARAAEVSLRGQQASPAPSPKEKLTRELRKQVSTLMKELNTWIAAASAIGEGQLQQHSKNELLQSLQEQLATCLSDADALRAGLADSVAAKGQPPAALVERTKPAMRLELDPEATSASAVAAAFLGAQSAGVATDLPIDAQQQLAPAQQVETQPSQDIFVSQQELQSMRAQLKAAEALAQELRDAKAANEQLAADAEAAKAELLDAQTEAAQLASQSRLLAEELASAAFAAQAQATAQSPSSVVMKPSRLNIDPDATSANAVAAAFLGSQVDTGFSTDLPIDAQKQLMPTKPSMRLNLELGADSESSIASALLGGGQVDSAEGVDLPIDAQQDGLADAGSSDGAQSELVRAQQQVHKLQAEVAELQTALAAAEDATAVAEQEVESVAVTSRQLLASLQTELDSLRVQASSEESLAEQMKNMSAQHEDEEHQLQTLTLTIRAQVGQLVAETYDKVEQYLEQATSAMEAFETVSRDQAAHGNDDTAMQTMAQELQAAKAALAAAETAKVALAEEAEVARAALQAVGRQRQAERLAQGDGSPIASTEAVATLQQALAAAEVANAQLVAEAESTKAELLAAQSSSNELVSLEAVEQEVQELQLRLEESQKAIASHEQDTESLQISYQENLSKLQSELAQLQTKAVAVDPQISNMGTIHSSSVEERETIKTDAIQLVNTLSAAAHTADESDAIADTPALTPADLEPDSELDASSEPKQTAVAGIDAPDRVAASSTDQDAATFANSNNDESENDTSVEEDSVEDVDADTARAECFRWLQVRQLSELIDDVVTALTMAEYPPETWLGTLVELARDDELENFIASVRGSKSKSPSKGPSASPSPRTPGGRRMSIAVDGMQCVLEQAQMAATQMGALPDETFLVSPYSKKSVTQNLKVGSQGCQLFDKAGMKLISSWPYFKMDSWEYQARRKKFVIKVKEGPKKVKKVELRTEEGNTIAQKMQERASHIAAAVKDNAAGKQETAKSLEGLYQVAEFGCLVRKEPDMESDEIAAIKPGEYVAIDQALPNYKGGFKTRLHVQVRIFAAARSATPPQHLLSYRCTFSIDPSRATKILANSLLTL